MTLDYCERCPECGREKAHSVEDVMVGKCPKWWAIRDQAAEDDCVFYAQKARDKNDA